MRKGLLLSLLIGLAAQLYYFSSLPGTVANHFGPGGVANGWMSNTANFIVCSLTLLINTAIFLSVPRLLDKFPVSYVSFPKKDFWLAPERKKQSIVLIASWIGFFGLLTNLFLLAVFQLLYQANQLIPARLDEDVFLVFLGGYFFLTVGWLVLLYRRFSRIEI